MIRGARSLARVLQNFKRIPVRHSEWVANCARRTRCQPTNLLEILDVGPSLLPFINPDFKAVKSVLLLFSTKRLDRYFADNPF